MKQGTPEPQGRGLRAYVAEGYGTPEWVLCSHRWLNTGRAAPSPPVEFYRF
jgi:hypothetical protein